MNGGDAIMTYESNWLAHHGVKGQKWGVRRFQNEDGTLTSEGKARDRKENSDSRASTRQQKREAKEMNAILKQAKKAFTSGNLYKRAKINRKLYESDKVQKLADDKDLEKKHDQEVKTNLKKIELGDKKRDIERETRVYGDDLDAWTPKDGKEIYGIDEKQFNAIWKARNDYSAAKKRHQKAYDDYNKGSTAKAQSFVNQYLQNPYSKVKVKKNAEGYTTYMSYLLSNYYEDKPHKNK